MKESSSKNKSATWILFLLLIGALGISLWYLTQSRDEVSDLAAEKVQLTAELQQLMLQYDKLELANDSLQDVASAEKQRLMNMIDSVQNLRSGDFQKLDRFKNEIFKLKVENKKLVTRLDSMSVRIEELQAEKQAVETSLSMEQERSRTLDNVRKGLEQEVAKGSLLQIGSMSAEAIKRWSSGKETPTERARRADEIKVCFTIAKNPIAPKGERMVYARVINPELTVVSVGDSTEGSFFNHNGSSLIYSTKKAVWYEGEPLNQCLYVKREKFTSGNYKIEIYTDEQLLGEISLNLK